MTSLKIKVIAINELEKEMGKMLLFVSHIEFAFAIGKLCIFIKYCLYLKRMFPFITWQRLSVKRLKAKKKVLHMINYDFRFYIKNIIKMKLLFSVTNIIQSNC